MTLQGEIKNDGSATAPYDFTAAGAEVDYAGVAQTIWSAATPVTYDKLTVSTAGTKSLNGNAAVASALSVAAGDLSIGAHTLTVDGTYSTVGTVTGGTSSNIALGGSGDLAAFAVTNGLNNLTVTRNNTVTLSSGLTLAGVATLSNGTLSLPASTALTLNGTGTVIVGTSSSITTVAGSVVSYASGTNQDIFGMNYNDLALGAAGNKTFPNSTVGIAGILTNAGSTIVPGTGTIDLNGTSAQTIPTFAFYNLITSGGNTKTATGALTVGNNFTNASGTVLNMSTSALTVAGTITNTGATVQFGGVSNGIAIASGTVEYNGLNSITQDIGAGTYASILLTNGTGGGTAAKQIGNGVTVITTGSLTLPSSTSLTLANAASALDVYGDFNVAGAVTNNGTITVGN
ncbi:MAG: hypothetical protein NTX44_03725 [Ignavibacteriales bacterium]|nr:hypothetical protein [Ignavibacteriales bacterium]